MNEPKKFQGAPPADLIYDEYSGDWHWRCQCGHTGVSSTVEWAHSDVERHRQAQEAEAEPCP